MRSWRGSSREAPPLAVVERVQHASAPAARRRAASRSWPARRRRPDAPVTPDTATCADCLAELFDPADRRYRYPFINCTNCGPRFTIVRGVPYDRPLTTMAGFVMCAACQAEYEDPADRRFHAQPNACPECGPRLGCWSRRRDADRREAPAIRWRRRWRRCARRDRRRQGDRRLPPGLSGRRRACRGPLRARKHREDKPFALMAATLPAAEALVVWATPSGRC